VSGERRRLLPGAERLLAEQAAELPQKDELCGAFQGLLALRAAAVAGSERLDQDAVALAAGSVLSSPPRSGSLPPEERGRDDFRVALPVAAAGAQVGTSARGLARAIERLAGGTLTVVPATGAWSTGALETLLDRALGSPAPLAAIANFDVARLWDARAGCPPAPGAAVVPEAIANVDVAGPELPRGDGQRARRYLDEGLDPGPDSPWRVGHFAALAGVRRGRTGTLVTVIDSYRSLGEAGVHEQPVERVAAALVRDGRRPGGVLLVLPAACASTAREWVRAASLEPMLWDNGSPDVRAER